MKYPAVLDASLVGTYAAAAKSGGGYVWDAVLEYRVWCHPKRGAPDEADGSDYFFAFASFEEAAAFSEECEGAEDRLRLFCSASGLMSRKKAATSMSVNRASPSGE